MYKGIFPAMFMLVLSACHNGNADYDASGSFEADEVIVSAEMGGRILSLQANEGDRLAKDSIVGIIDSSAVALQKAQVEASIAALKDKTADVAPQVRLLQDQLHVQQAQLDNLMHEKERISNLLKADAATGKQLDDINAQILLMQRQMDVTRQQISVQQNAVATQNRAVLSEKQPLAKRVAQLNDQLDKTRIVNPVEGTVITRYAEPGEITAPGKALYKIANLQQIYLRAYVTGNQLAALRLGQELTVKVDDGKGGYRDYKGKITWISDKAEFTPKTIQTRDERANLVYAIKVAVANDGLLKIGMYGEVKF
jgi:HlyD family secretion protein